MNVCYNIDFMSFYKSRFAQISHINKHHTDIKIEFPLQKIRVMFFYGETSVDDEFHRNSALFFSNFLFVYKYRIALIFLLKVNSLANHQNRTVKLQYFYSVWRFKSSHIV